LVFKVLTIFFYVLVVDIFDVVRVSKDNLFLMDFAPFCKDFTDFLAYDLEQLEDLSNIMEVSNKHLKQNSITVYYFFIIG
jgi:hypothetical protein